MVLNKNVVLRSVGENDFLMVIGDLNRYVRSLVKVKERPGLLMKRIIVNIEYFNDQ